LNANASPITFSFSVTATSGPLDGITENGTFTYDSSSIIPGGLNDNTGLLTGLNFTWNGIAYNQTTANTGLLLFDSSGHLTKALFGDNCIASECSDTGGTNEWSLFAIPGETTTPPFGFAYATPSTGVYEGTVTTALSPIPEPSTLALFGVGVAGLMLVGAGLRSRRALLPA
jgi:PEP-CTERM motif